MRAHCAVAGRRTVKTADDLLHDFGLAHVASLPRDVLAERVERLAAFAAAYDATYEKLSVVLQRRTAKLRQAEESAGHLTAVADRLRVIAAMQAEVMVCTLTWHEAMGTDREPEASAALRAALVRFVSVGPETSQDKGTR